MHIGDAGSDMGTRRCQDDWAGRLRILSDNPTRLISISLVRVLGDLGLLSRDAVSNMIHCVVLSLINLADLDRRLWNFVRVN